MVAAVDRVGRRLLLVSLDCGELAGFRQDIPAAVFTARQSVAFSHGPGRALPKRTVSVCGNKFICGTMQLAATAANSHMRQPN